MAKNEIPVQALITDDCEEVRDLVKAQAIAAHLLGSPREVESDGGGGWLVGFTDDELTELVADGEFVRGDDLYTLEAEWI